MALPCPRGFLLAALLAVGSPLQAQDASEAADAGAWRTRGIGSIFLLGGSLGYDPDPQLPGLEGRATWGVGLSFFPGPPFPANAVGFDFHVWGLSRSYPSLVQGAAEPATELTTAAFALGARAGLPVAWPVGVSLLGGLTYVDHSMKVDGQPAWFLPGIDQTWEEDDAAWSPYWGVAAEARLGALALGLEKRWVETAATFDDPFALTDVELGGSATLVTLTWFYGR